MLGIAFVVCGIVWLRLHPVFALAGGAMLVAVLTPLERAAPGERVAVAFGAAAGKIGLLVAFAWGLGRPSAMSAGMVAKVPPPASAFIAPPTSPAPAASAIAKLMSIASA